MSVVAALAWLLIMGGVLTLFLRARCRADEYVTAHWIDQHEHGLYDGEPRHDPDDWTRVRMLKRLADAQHKNVQ